VVVVALTLVAVTAVVLIVVVVEVVVKVEVVSSAVLEVVGSVVVVVVDVQVTVVVVPALVVLVVLVPVVVVLVEVSTSLVVVVSACVVVVEVATSHAGVHIVGHSSNTNALTIAFVQSSLVIPPADVSSPHLGLISGSHDGLADVLSAGAGAVVPFPPTSALTNLKDDTSTITTATKTADGSLPTISNKCPRDVAAQRRDYVLRQQSART
jgi:hypothetical protein